MIGKYEIRGRLGAGAMGSVLDAFDPVIERRSALKIIPKPAADDAEGQESLARFKREAQAAGRLNHPNIVAVHDYGEDDSRAWIAMEMVEGGSLKQLLDQGQRLPLAETLRVMGQVLAGLDYSHKRGVVHRDIKPANLMLTPEGPGGRQVKIADFGIARVENSSMTQVGTVMGTPAYMAPEQLRGETVDARADIWAAGVLLYQLLTGEKPFEGGYSSVMHKTLNTEPTPPSAIAVTAPRGLDAVIAKAMAKRPEDRFASAAAFAEAMRLAAQPADPVPAEATLVARAPTAPPQAAPAGKSGPPVALIGGAAALLVAAGVGYLMLAGPSAPPPAAVTASVSPPVAHAPAAVAPPSLSPSAAALVPAAPAPVLPPASSSAPQLAQPAPAVPPPVMPSPAPAAPVVQQTTPSAPPPAPVVASPAAPTPASLATWASRAVALLPGCSLVARGSNDTFFTLEGVLPRGGEASLRQALAASDIPTESARLALQEFDGPYCPALAALRPVLAEAGLAPRVAMQGPSPLRAGDLLRFSVIMPDWPANLYVAYFMKSGEVAHLVPSATHPPGATVRLGEPRAGFPGWEVSEPFGTDLLVAVASEGPLFTGAPRPLVESQEAYLAALGDALRASREAGRRVMVRPAVMETVPR